MKQKQLSLLLFSVPILLFASSSVSGQFTQSQMVEEWKRAKDYTKEYLDAMPVDGYGFRPVLGIRTFAEQMLHIADVNYFFSSLAIGKPSPFGQTVPDHKQLERTVVQTKDATNQAVMDSYDFVIQAIQTMTRDQLQETINFAKQDITRFGMFGKGFEHQTHHRGQTTIYLRLKGITPPGEKLF
jgi:uncharacterized damage-inducible protein DinB